MTAAAIERERYVLADDTPTVQLYPPRTEPREWPPVIGRHRFDRDGAIPVSILRAKCDAYPWPPSRRVALWLTFVLYAVLVPVLLACLAVLAGCVPSEDWPVTDGPATTVPVPMPGGAR